MDADLLKGKMVVYTAIFGDYDYLKDPEYITENCDFLCFTDSRNLHSDIWQIQYMPAGEAAYHTPSGASDNTRRQRRCKILAHEYLPDGYEWSVYVDGNVRIIGDFRQYIAQESKGAPILCLKHPDRDHVYEEAEECIRLGKDDPQMIRRQMEHYKQEGFAQQKLIVANILARKHRDPDVIRLMELWWNQLETYSRRDQLSFNYACWKLGMSYDVSELKCWKSPYWMNPGIHTADIRKVEEELIDHIQLEAYLSYQIREKEQYAALKEQELKDAGIQLGWKEQELADAQTRYEWKEQELADAETRCRWKEQELADAQTRYGWKEQELADAETRYRWKEQELADAQTRYGWKERELADLKIRFHIIENEMIYIKNSRSWKYTRFFRAVKAFIYKKDRNHYNY